MKKFWFSNLPQSPHQHFFSIFLTVFIIIEASLSENCSDIKIATLCLNSFILAIIIGTSFKQVNDYLWDGILLLQLCFSAFTQNDGERTILMFQIQLLCFRHSFSILISCLTLIIQEQSDIYIQILIFLLLLQSQYNQFIQPKSFLPSELIPFQNQIANLLLNNTKNGYAIIKQQEIITLEIEEIKNQCHLIEMQTFIYGCTIQDQLKEIQMETIPIKQQKFNTFHEFLKQYITKKSQFSEKLFIVLKDKIQHTKYSVQLSELHLQQISEQYIVIKYDVIFLFFIFFYQTFINHIDNKKTKFNQNFISSLTHKLKTPLSSALIHLQVVVKDDTIIKSIKTNHLMPAYLNCQLQLYSVQDIMDYLNQNYQKLEPKVQPIDLIKVIQNALKLVEYSCKQKSIQLKFTVNQQEKNEYEPFVFMTDENKLTRILINILNNSYRYTNLNGYISIDLNTNANNQAHFKIKDNGVGITKQKQLQLNQLLSNQLNLFKSQKDIYIGLGLQVSNQLVKILNNSETPIKFKVNQFTVFKFYIDSQHDLNSASLRQSQRNIESYRSAKSISQGPKSLSQYSQNNRQRSNMDEDIKLSTDEIEFEPSQQKLLVMTCSNQSNRMNSQTVQVKPLIINSIYSQKKTKQSSMGLIDQQDIDQGYILIVDDEPFNHVSISLILKQIKITQIKSAYNGQECLDFIKLNQDKIRLVLMDVDMPIMNGIQATKRIIDQQKLLIWKQFPVIGFTAHQDMKTQKQCLDAGMLIVLQKPVILKTLYDVIKMVEDSNELENLKRHSSQIL